MVWDLSMDLLSCDLSNVVFTFFFLFLITVDVQVSLRVP